ncbi:unnamed protein product [Choristocarpus tenellus]
MWERRSLLLKLILCICFLVVNEAIAMTQRRSSESVLCGRNVGGYWEWDRPRMVVACTHHTGLGAWSLTDKHAQMGPVSRFHGQLLSLLSAGSILHAAIKVAALQAQEGDEGGLAVDKVKGVMISFIKAYKRELSPLLPPSCRFEPTCSVYAVEAIETFGPTKGAVLTAWRLMRCNPFAGYGFDPPQWPPPAWFAGKKWK